MLCKYVSKVFITQMHSAEKCTSPPFFSFFIPHFFRNMQPHLLPVPLDTHHGKIPDSIMIQKNQGD